MKQPLYNQKGQLTGMIDDGRLLKSGVDPAKHQLRHPPAYAIDKAHIDILIEESGWGVELLTVNGDVWIAPLGQFLLHGINLDRGAGKQVALPLQYWTKQDGRQMSMFNG